MKRSDLLAASGIALCLSPCPMAMSASTHGAWDVSLRGGYADTLENTYYYEIQSGNSGPGAFSFHFDSSYVLAAAIGYEFTDGWRAELELGYQRFKASEYDALGATFPTTAEIAIWSPSIRAAYDIVSGSWGGLAVGAGLGASYLRLSTSPNNETVENTDWAISGELFTELRWQFYENAFVTAEYRYGFIDEFLVAHPDAATDIYYKGDHWQHAILVGLRYKFPGNRGGT